MRQAQTSDRAKGASTTCQNAYHDCTQF